MISIISICISCVAIGINIWVWVQMDKIEKDLKDRGKK